MVQLYQSFLCLLILKIDQKFLNCDFFEKREQNSGSVLDLNINCLDQWMEFLTVKVRIDLHL